MLNIVEVKALQTLAPAGRLLFTTRIIRMFAYGFLSVVLALYLAERGFDERQIGLILTLTLIGDAVISLWISLVADRIGRRRMLMIGAGLMIFGGWVLAFTGSPFLLIIAAIVGTISPTGNEVGPFLSIEQAALTQTTENQFRTSVFVWYNLLGSLATAVGALTAGGLTTYLQNRGSTALDSYRLILASYGVIGGILLVMFTRLGTQVEPPIQIERKVGSRFGLHRSRPAVLKLSALFMLDAFGGGLVLQSVMAYWFFRRFGVDTAVLGGIFFGANLLSGFSALVAGRIAARYGLINTMVWTHIPSNILLILVPLMPTLPLAILVLLLRFSISQMDVPTRQSYVMAMVDPDERSAAAGITSIARTAASAISPTLTGILFGAGLLYAPFFLAGTLKIIYDLSLYRSFIAVKPPEEI